MIDASLIPKHSKQKKRMGGIFCCASRSPCPTCHRPQAKNRYTDCSSCQLRKRAENTPIDLCQICLKEDQQYRKATYRIGSKLEQFEYEHNLHCKKAVTHSYCKTCIEIYYRKRDLKKRNKPPYTLCKDHAQKRYSWYSTPDKELFGIDKKTKQLIISEIGDRRIVRQVPGYRPTGSLGMTEWDDGYVRGLNVYRGSNFRRPEPSEYFLSEDLFAPAD